MEFRRVPFRSQLRLLSRLASRRRSGKSGSGIKEREMDVSAWHDWIGRTESRSDSVDPAPLARWLATLDRDPTADGTAPQGFHWCLALPDAPTNALGADETGRAHV